MARSFIALDLGTACTRIWTQERGIILRAPTAAALDDQTHELVALAEDARKMLGKTPGNISAYRPIKDGVISDYEVTYLMLEAFFNQTQIRTTFRRPSVLIATPCRITEVHQLAVENAVMEAGARAVAQVPAIYAAAAGAGLRVRSPRGCMIVNIGAGLTEVAIISSGGIIRAKSVRMAGERFDVLLGSYLSSRCELLVGDMAAEEIKIRVGAAVPGLRHQQMQAYGRHSRTGMGATCAVDTADVYRAVRPAIEAISNCILSTLESVAPEISGDIHTYGLMLCGGSATMPGLDRAIAEETGLRVTIARSPADCVIRGLGMIVRSPDLWGEELKPRTRLLF